MGIADAIGFELTADDLIESNPSEIPDEYLEKVAGGCKAGEVVWSAATFGICRLWGVANTCNKTEQGCH